MRKAINRFKTVGSTLVVGVLLTFGLSACGESNNIDCADLTIHMDDTGRSVTFQDDLYHESGNTYSFWLYASGLTYSGIVEIAPDGTLIGDGQRYIDDEKNSIRDFSITGAVSPDGC